MPGTLDATAFPHIVDTVIGHLVANSPGAALGVQTVCKAWRELTCSGAFAHLRVGERPLAQSTAIWRGKSGRLWAISLTGPGLYYRPRRGFFSRLQRVSDTIPSGLVSSLQYTRVLDFDGLVRAETIAGLTAHLPRATIVRFLLGRGGSDEWTNLLSPLPATEVVVFLGPHLSPPAQPATPSATGSDNDEGPLQCDYITHKRAPSKLVLHVGEADLGSVLIQLAEWRWRPYRTVLFVRPLDPASVAAMDDVDAELRMHGLDVAGMVLTYHLSTYGRIAVVVPPAADDVLRRCVEPRLVQPSNVRFVSEDEYREEVGEEKYALHAREE